MPHVIAQIYRDLYAILDRAQRELEVVGRETEKPDDEQREADHGRRKASEHGGPSKRRECLSYRVHRAPLSYGRVVNEPAVVELEYTSLWVAAHELEVVRRHEHGHAVRVDIPE